MYGQKEGLASHAVQAEPQDSPDPGASVSDRAQRARELSRRRSAAHGCGEGALEQHELLQEEPGAQESTLQKGCLQSGGQSEGGESSQLGSLPSIANLPRISSQDCDLQVHFLFRFGEKKLS